MSSSPNNRGGDSFVPRLTLTPSDSLTQRQSAIAPNASTTAHVQLSPGKARKRHRLRVGIVENDAEKPPASERRRQQVAEYQTQWNDIHEVCIFSFCYMLP